MELMSRGTLKRLAHQKNLLNDLTLFAESHGETFEDVQVITLEQYAKEQALEQALREFSEEEVIRDSSIVHNRVNFLVETEYASAKEFISIEPEMIRIGVNRSKIDDAAIDYALSLLIQIDAFNPGIKFEFGEKITIRERQTTFLTTT